MKVDKSTIITNFPLYCPKCKSETWISVKNFKVIVEPDAKTQSQ
ncbi:conjugal transfer protein [Listeria welshimeri]|nr:conjugal transfer protein [Listeria welshimeri]